MCIRGIKFSILTLILTLILGCASSPDAPSPVLEPVVESTDAPPPVEPAPPKASDKLMQQLGELGYEGFGMEYEDPATLTLLEKVFAAPEAQNLDLKLVYTGGRLQYDKVQKSVTIGGTKNLRTILNFLKKSVPKRRGPPPPKHVVSPAVRPVPKPAVNPEPSPSESPAPDPTPNPPASEPESSPQ